MTAATTVMRRYPRINGPAALPLFCLAPHGVFRASRIAPRAVSSYLAFSPLPDLRCQRTGGIFSVTLSVTAILQLRRPRVLRGMLPYGVRTFLSRISPAPAIICHRAEATTFSEGERIPRTKGTTVTTDSSEYPLCSVNLWRFQFKSATERSPKTSSPSRERSQFAEHAGKIAEQRPPARASGADQTFPGHEFPGDRAHDRTDDQSGKGKNNPTIAPTMAPNAPHFVAPNRFAPK